MSDYPRFGLNSGASVKEISYQKSEYGESVRLTCLVKGKEFWQYYNLPTHVYVDGKKSQDKKKLKEAQLQTKADIKSIFEAFLGKPAVEMFETHNQSVGFKGFAEGLIKELPEDYMDTAMDIFLHYQWKPRKGQTRTFLELPKSAKHGAFICPSKGEGWEKSHDESAGDDDVALKYLKGGREHPFKRTGWYMGSNFSHKTGEEVVEDQRPNRQEPETPAAPAAEDDDLPF